MVEKVKFDGEHANTLLAKQLFLWDKKKKENMWLICAAHDNDFDMKDLNKYLPVGNGNLRGCDPEPLEQFLGCKKGMVNFFSMINDADKKVKVIIDKRLLEAEWASFHPMDNTASTAINREGILKIKELSGRDDSNFEVLDFSTIASAPGAGNAKPQK